MALDTSNAKDVCTVSFYQRMIQQLPDQGELPVTSSSLSGIEETPLENDSESRRCVAEARTNQRQKYSTNMSREFVALGEQLQDETKYLYISDSSCTEAPSFPHIRRNRRHRKKVSSRSSRQVANYCQIAGDLDSGDSAEDCGEHGTSEISSDSEFDQDESLPLTHKLKMEKWKTLANGRFEEMLLECIVNTDHVPPNYQNIFIDRGVIDKVEHVTMLGLKRPLAFSHGVLKSNKVTGAILYGPPGTGKTLLARGVAKQSGFDMLSISTSEIWQKCHGDDEKMIQAVFSMARKMYPSIIFLDEADAMLGERKAGEKRHLRSMLNKFLSEWDGITSSMNSPFILLATNRPSDLDPAVLRRAPMRIEFSLPTKEERFGILKLLLCEETLGADISLSALVNLTQQYTGSDLKNLCVTAATECISEQRVDTAERVLTRRHFIAALKVIKATTIGKTREKDLENFQNSCSRQDQVDG
ncbi:hypothetical protein MKX08_007704 [Trichoderma sp. CBMAI-0020]|nr:hypothetical protein MKX08_007704 [Trichoderma sp. CBMAI-0020]